MRQLKCLCEPRVWVALVALLTSACCSTPIAYGSVAMFAKTMTLRLNTKRLGAEFDPGAVGLSTETEELSRGRLSAQNHSLVELMRLLGPSLLRVGGNSVNYSWWTSDDEPTPAWANNAVTPADLAALLGLLRATGWRVLLGVDLGHYEPTRAADEAQLANEILGPSLAGIEIGNEPDEFAASKELRLQPYDLTSYLGEAAAYVDAVDASAPGLPVYGPALSRLEWLPRLQTNERIFSEITQHFYPTSTCLQPTPLELSATTEALLSPVVRQREHKAVKALVAAGAVADRPTRIDETNGTSCRTSALTGPVFASALWAMDWALRAVSAGVEGINFNAGFGFCGSASASPMCISSQNTMKRGEESAQPEYYGLLAAGQLEGGRFVSSTFVGERSPQDLTTWATMGPGGVIKVAIDNLAIAGPMQPVSIRASGYTTTVESLTGASPEATHGVRLGGAMVNTNGTWRPKPVALRAAKGMVRVFIRAASAAVVTLRPVGVRS